MGYSLNANPDYPYAVGIRQADTAEGYTTSEYVHFSSKEAAAIFADLMDGEPNHVTRWVLSNEDGKHVWHRVSYFHL